MINCTLFVLKWSGFQALHSTTTAVLFAVDNWLLNMDKILINGVLYLDLQKAFDSATEVAYRY